MLFTEVKYISQDFEALIMWCKTHLYPIYNVSGMLYN